MFYRLQSIEERKTSTCYGTKDCIANVDINKLPTKDKKLVIKKCYDCKYYIFRVFTSEHFCYNKDIPITKIENPNNIPIWCPLEDNDT